MAEYLRAQKETNEAIINSAFNVQHNRHMQ